MSDKRVDRLRYLGLHCTKLRDENWRDEFSMRVPAEEDRDADLVLCWAADRIESLEAENAALREAIKCVWVRWHEWRDDQYAATLLALEKAIDEAGELIPPPEEQK